MPRITNDRNTHVSVFAVNMLSFKKYHVKIGNVRYDMPNIKNLGPHTSCITSYVSFTPYRKHRPAGIEYNIAPFQGFSAHHSHTN